MTKLMELDELAACVPDGVSIALGGSMLHGAPYALARALVRRGARDLELVKPSPGYDLDLLCRGRALRRARVGIAAMDAELGLLPAYRRAVEQGELELEEHSCITVVSGLRAAAYGVPFMPVAGLDHSDIPVVNGWRRIADPYGGDQAPYVVPAVRPDITILHVNAADDDGNGRLQGSPQWDRIMSRAADTVLLTAERLVERAELEAQPELTVVPGFMVRAVSIVPRGAWPGSMYPDYDADLDAVREYIREPSLAAHLASAPEPRHVSHAR